MIRFSTIQQSPELLLHSMASKKTPLFKPIHANQTKPTITITHPKPWTLPGSSQLLC